MRFLARALHSAGRLTRVVIVALLVFGIAQASAQTPPGSLVATSVTGLSRGPAGVSGLLNAVVAADLPGPGTVFLGVEWRFVKAVRVGEEITARVEVTAVREDKPICTLATTVRNADGEACLTGTAVTWTAPLR